MKLATKAIHVGQAADLQTGATVPPLTLSTTFTQEGIGRHKGFEYSRTGNPTRQSLEACLASLEEAKFGLCFASGMAAISGVLSILRPGDHVVAGEDIYGGTYRLFERVLRPAGLTFTYIDSRTPESVEAAVLPSTRMVWVESPSNPLLHLTDLEAVGRICSRRGIRLAVDNTFATPCLQRPLSTGAALVVHSTTKYLGGHSDVVGGAVLTNDPELRTGIAFYQNAAGAVPSPFDCWLTLRGLKTLEVRMERHEANARKVAAHLESHASVTRVYYPGLASHPQHELAKRQMSGFGGMVSFELKGGVSAANRFAERVRLFAFAESLGGVESLCCYPPAMTHGSIPEAERLRRGITPGMMRLSVGLEAVEDLIDDLEQALR